LPVPAGARRQVAGDRDLGLDLPEDVDVDAFLRAALAAGASILSVAPRRESLEDLFVREAKSGSPPAASPEPSTRAPA
jgi:hypothetical protein